MNFLEKNLEDIIYDALRSDFGYSELTERGLDSIGPKPIRVFRQLRIGKYGVADIVTCSIDYHEYGLTEEVLKPFLVVNIYELKKNEVNLETFIQSLKYYKGIKRYLNYRGLFSSYDVKYNIILIGNNVETTSNWVYLFDYIESLDICDNETLDNIFIYNYIYELSGILFELNTLSDYKLMDEGFEKEVYHGF